MEYISIFNFVAKRKTFFICVNIKDENESRLPCCLPWWYFRGFPAGPHKKIECVGWFITSTTSHGSLRFVGQAILFTSTTREMYKLYSKGNEITHSHIRVDVKFVRLGIFGVPWALYLQVNGRTLCRVCGLKYVHKRFTMGHRSKDLVSLLVFTATINKCQHTWRHACSAKNSGCRMRPSHALAAITREGK